MSFEHLESLPNVESVATQERIIFSITSQRKLSTYCRDRFVDGTRNAWVAGISRHARQNEMDPEYFRLAGIVANGGAQFGFESMTGQGIRHKIRKWQVSYAHPRHQVAMASYLGRINTQAYELKQQFSEEHSGNTPVEAGIWGVKLGVKDGDVTSSLETTIYRMQLRRQAELRFQNHRLISLPNQELNAALASLEFTGEDAEAMPNNEFYDDVLPRVVSALYGYLDPGLIDFHLNQTDRFYFLRPHPDKFTIYE